MRARSFAEKTYHAAQQDYNASVREKLSSVSDQHKWWSTLKSAVFGSQPSIPPLLDSSGELVTRPVDKANLLMSHFDSKLSHNTLQLNENTESVPILTSMAFKSKEVERLLLDLDTHGGTDPVGMFPLFLKETAAVLAPKVSAVFRLLVRTGIFPKCWKVANITPIPKGSPSPDVTNYRPISITPIFSKVFEHLVSNRLSRFFEQTSLLSKHQFAYRKNLGTTDALLTVTHTLQEALDRGREARCVQLDFTAAFDRVNHAGLIWKLQRTGIGGKLLSILSLFLKGRIHRVGVDGSFSEWHEVHSGVPQGSVLGPLLFNIYTSDLFQVTDNPLYGYADDVTLVATVDLPQARPSVCSSLNEDLCRISTWCTKWDMKINPAKSKSLCFSRSRTVFPLHGDLVVDGSPIANCCELDILGVKFDSKLTFESHIRAIVSSASRKLGILRKAYTILQDASISVTCFRCFILPLLEYCAPVWSSAAASHLRLIDKVFRTAQFLCNGNVLCNLSHRRDISCLCMLYKIRASLSHPLHGSIPALYVATRLTRGAFESHRATLQEIRCRTNQFQRSFLPATVSIWNSLNNNVIEANNIQTFKSRANKLLISRLAQH